MASSKLCGEVAEISLTRATAMVLSLTGNSPARSGRVLD